MNEEGREGDRGGVPPSRSVPPPPPPPVAPPGSGPGSGGSTVPPWVGPTRPVPPPPPPPANPWSSATSTRLIPLHPMSVGDVLDGTFRLLRATWSTVAVVVLVAYVPIEVLRALIAPTNLTFGASQELPVGSALGFSLLTFLVSPLVTGAVTWVVAERDRGTSIDWIEAYRAAGRRYLPLVGASVLTGLIAGALMLVVALPLVLLGAVTVPVLGVLAAVVVGIVLVVALVGLLYVIVPAVMLEGLGPWQAIRRSVRLLRPRFWSVIGIVLLAGLLILLVGGMLGGVFGLVASVTGPVGWVFAAVGGIVNQLVAIPLGANIALLVYVDARIRQEGYDLEILLGSS